MMDILVADDNEIVLETLVDLLRHEGHTATKCKDGVTALALLESCPFELLITDIQMPGLSGIEVTFAVRERSGPELPVILISGLDEHAGLEAALAHPRTRLIRKPLRMNALLDAIDSLTAALSCAD